MTENVDIDRMVFCEVTADRSIAGAWLGARIAAGTPVGLLGYLDSEPVAWCSVAPRSTYRRLVDDDSADTGIWSIVCFFVVRRLRGRGAVHRLIAAACPATAGRMSAQYPTTRSRTLMRTTARFKASAVARA